MEISYSAWRELQHSLTEDFVDLLLPPTYTFCVDTSYPRTAGMEALIEDRLTSIDFPEQKILSLESLVKEQHAEDLPDRIGDWGVLFSYYVLEGFGHKLTSNLEGAELEGLKQLASLWGTYLAREMERFFKRRQQSELLSMIAYLRGLNLKPELDYFIISDGSHRINWGKATHKASPIIINPTKGNTPRMMSPIVTPSSGAAEPRR